MVTIQEALPYISVLIATLAFFRNTKTDTKADIVSITTVTNKLDNISDGIREIKSGYEGTENGNTRVARPRN